MKNNDEVELKQKDKMYDTLNQECIRLRKQIQRIGNKTCDNCKHWVQNNESRYKGYCSALGIHNIGGCGDYFEEKEK